MKTRVAVEVNLMRVVYVEVEHDESESPLDLTVDEQEQAKQAATESDAEDFGAEIVGVRVKP